MTRESSIRSAVFDIETNGFYEDVSKIFCISIKDLQTGENTLYEPDEIKQAIRILLSYDVLIGHNILGYDLPVIEKLYKPFKGKVYDTLILSRLRYPFFESHSLKAWGERLKFRKIDYNNFSYYEPEMGEYCKQDVEVTAKVFKHLSAQLDIDADYCKLEHDVQRLQTKAEIHGVAFDYEAAMKLSMAIGSEMDDIKSKVEPALGYSYEDIEHKLKKDGELSHHAIRLLTRLDEDFPDIPIEVSKTECTSVIRVPAKITLDTKKELISKLLDVGWKPTMFTEKGTPQISVKGEVCENLLNLSDEYSIVGRYFILKHRKSLVDGFFKYVRKDGKIPSEANTLGAVTGRYTHRKIVNLPAVRSIYGMEIRSLFGVPEGRVQVGCDLSGIEARMLAHYMNDPEYTNEILNGDIHTKNQEAAGLPTRDAAKTFFLRI